jgi:hypothetical protein
VTITARDEAVLVALEADITSALVAEYGAGHAATRNWSKPTINLTTGECPHVRIWDDKRFRQDVTIGKWFIHVTMYGFVLKEKSDTGLIATKLNHLRAVLHAKLDPYGLCRDWTCYPGDERGLLVYPMDLFFSE